MNQETISIAEAKKTFSELLGKVAYGKKRIVITKRGKPMALLSPPEEIDSPIFEFKGWLKESDPFFSAIDRIVQERADHNPRVFKRKK
jgi:prevent-host-death family protein